MRGQRAGGQKEEEESLEGKDYLLEG